MQPVALIPWIVLGALLAALARRIPSPIVGAVLVVAGVAVFAVRAHHAGPYPFPGPMDFAAGSAALVLGMLLVRSRWRVPRQGAVSPVTRILLGVSPLVLLVALAAFGHEAEEVVVLRTTTRDGRTHETRLWIVDHRGSAWVVTGRDTDQDRDVSADPRVEIARGGQVRCFVAERHLDRATLETLLRARSEKYAAQRLALASRLWRDFREVENLDEIAVAIRFEPCA